MASEENNYTPEFKKEVAQKALEQSKQNLDTLSEEYGVPVSVILMWAVELEKGGEEVFKKADEETSKTKKEHDTKSIDITISDEEVSNSIEHGVMFDNLDYKRLMFWSVLGIILVIIFIQGLFEMFEYNKQTLEDRVSARSGEFYQSNQLKKEAEEKLTNFGVVNLEEGTYRIPIDSIINNMAVDAE
ncbi:MAG TPA: hypothetical protein VK074_02230 [Fodinibius sp.]|nr:hypothetical protein [Fodinibius sp.]